MFDRIRAAGLKLQPAICNIFCKEILYFGNVIKAANISLNLPKLRVLADWPVPITVCKLQSFVGCVNCYGDFIDDAINLTAPLYDLTVARKTQTQ